MMTAQWILKKRRKDNLNRIEAKLDAVLELLTAKPKRKPRAKPKTKPVPTVQEGVQ